MTPFEAPGLPLVAPATPVEQNAAMATPVLSTPAIPTGDALLRRFCTVRQQSLTLCQPLTAEDMMVQSCPEASPAKWHLAHTTWFFETFILREFLSGYQPFHPDFYWLFNSYYNSLSSQPEKKLRASFSRPGAEEILRYRAHVEEAVARLSTDMPDEARRRLVLGLHHEQQHQELLCYDIKNAFWSNPLHPAYAGDVDRLTEPAVAQPLRYIPYDGGLCDVGYEGDDGAFDRFSFDNEGPRHPEYLAGFQLASRLITCGEYLDFVNDGGYDRAELWLSDGWEMVKAGGWKAPLYWHREGDGEWSIFTMRGNATLAALRETPVCHVSYYEADAFAHWAGKRLPTEAEWEVAATKDAGSPTALGCNFLEESALHPLAASGHAGGSAPQQLFGDVWEWTRSPYIGYPGYKALPGALGEYNGKFMSSQMVLRGGSAVTPASHIRTTYRNFFSPAARWQFAGIRLADDLPAGLEK